MFHILPDIFEHFKKISVYNVEVENMFYSAGSPMHWFTNCTSVQV